MGPVQAGRSVTPIAQLLARDAVLPVSKRRYQNITKTLDVFDDWHFFECSAISHAAVPLGKKLMTGLLDMHDRQMPLEKASRLAFLPAPKVMIETDYWAKDRVKRLAFLLEEVSDHMASVRTIALARPDPRLAPDTIVPVPLALKGLPLFGSDHVGTSIGCDPGDDKDDATAEAILLYGILAMINTPRVIMRTQHMPHRGLERLLRAQRGLVGKFPLGAWTELLLKVQPPRVHEGEPIEAHLTGARALHFCRCHLRIRLGELELVSAHWRGDPALGIKQTRYRLEMA
jgi:hypothetical protein